ncbi:hypothetical protein [Sphingomonas colocasiae]|uniref:Cupin type-1 domain-containing protein n=1 Tax=Sphingomonas colocasiae TaxID=1848973 RepID=A0ABS7PIH6_9SPHN|nr:hypothetical protein [Sphingomonas colocasiae]MBY8820759.1 hypothetical protein [Sphingomonas colocasiae]
MSIVHDRAAAVAATVSRIRAIGLSPDPALNTPDKVADASDALRTLAARADLFPVAHFPLKLGGISGFYRLTEDDDFRNALYISVSPAKFFNARPHAHAHWALIAGVAGTEHNVIYERADDGSEPGTGRLRKTREVPVRAGDVLYMPRPEYHTVEYDGSETAINLHFYGLGLDSPEGLRAPSFRAADSDRYDIDSRPHAYWGVPRLANDEIAAARATAPGLAVIAVGAALPGHPDIAVIADPETPTITSDIAADVPILLVGSETATEIAAERLSRQGRTTVLRTEAAEAIAAL